jgi:hypothetical protein
MKKLLSIAIFALAVTASEAMAQGGVFVRFGPPPPPRVVVAARPSHRHVWVPGFYGYRRDRYYWNDGYWSIPPRGYRTYVPGYWQPRRGGYVWVGGYWR